MDINKRLKLLREEMKKHNFSAYLVNTSDPHSSEYLADHYKFREWISGFTGSAGLALITMEEALLWTDGRYFIQAEKEIASSEFKLFKMNTPGYPNYMEWLDDNLKEGDRIGVIGEIFPQQAYEKLEKKLENKEVKIIREANLIENIWEDRPEKPLNEIFIYKEKYSGESLLEKSNRIRKIMEKDNIDYYLLSSLDDIAWFLNIRGGDIDYNPVIISYLLISREDIFYFVDKEKINKNVEEYFDKNKIKVYNYEGIFDKVAEIEKNKTIYVDKSRINSLLYSKINSKVTIKTGIDYTSFLKARKNKVEIENQKNAYIKDGLALVKFFTWLEDNLNQAKINEYIAEEKLLEFRKLDPSFIEPSFRTISAYGPNAAMMHYAADEFKSSTLKPRGFYLVDSGGQYLEGTTDITRTISLGELTEEEKRDYTLTFKGHTNLITARFLEGSSGHYLDVLSRIPLWREGIDYKCGTGHGIGHLLNVHEGPHRIANVENNIALEKGMITSIEPGVYREGKHGIRLENIVYVDNYMTTDSGSFLQFNILSFVPIDTKPLIKSMLTKDEIDWLNNYHKEVYNKLSPFLEGKELDWLNKNTKSI